MSEVNTATAPVGTLYVTSWGDPRTVLRREIISNRMVVLERRENLRTREIRHCIDTFDIEGDSLYCRKCEDSSAATAQADFDRVVSRLRAEAAAEEAESRARYEASPEYRAALAAQYAGYWVAYTKDPGYALNCLLSAGFDFEVADRLNRNGSVRLIIRAESRPPHFDYCPAWEPVVADGSREGQSQAEAVDLARFVTP